MVAELHHHITHFQTGLAAGFPSVMPSIRMPLPS
jgi:hypothetical protein